MGKLAPQKIETVPIGTLKHHPKNPRKGDVKSITESIEHNGFYGVVVAQKSTGYVLAGNHRMMAAKAAGLDSLPVAYVDVDDATALKILLADNRTNDLATYDNKELAELLADVSNTIGLDGTGFDEAFLDGLIGELAQETPTGNADDVPEAQISKADELREKWQTELGQLWEVGRHRILCGDSTDEKQVAMLMDGKKADIAFTSPPYNAGAIEAKTGKNPKHAKQKYLSKDDDKTSEDYLDFMVNNINAMLKVSHEIFYNIQVLAGNRVSIAKLLNEFSEHFKDVLYWVKSSGTPHIQEGIVNSRVELILCFDTLRLPTRVFRRHSFTQGNGWNIIEGSNASSNNFAHIHKATFPIYLPIWVIGQFTRKDDTVLDTFLGTGTTCVACEQLSRTCYGMELDPAYVAVILERLSEMGLEPRLID